MKNLWILIAITSVLATTHCADRATGPGVNSSLDGNTDRHNKTPSPALSLLQSIHSSDESDNGEDEHDSDSLHLSVLTQKHDETTDSQLQLNSSAQPQSDTINSDTNCQPQFQNNSNSTTPEKDLKELLNSLSLTPIQKLMYRLPSKQSIANFINHPNFKPSAIAINTVLLSALLLSQIMQIPVQSNYECSGIETYNMHLCRDWLNNANTNNYDSETKPGLKVYCEWLLNR